MLINYSFDARSFGLSRTVVIKLVLFDLSSKEKKKENKSCHAVYLHAKLQDEKPCKSCGLMKETKLRAS